MEPKKPNKTQEEAQEGEAGEEGMETQPEGPAKYAEINEDEDAELKITSEEIDKHVAYLKSNKTWDDLQIPQELKENLLRQQFKSPSKIQCSVIGFFQKGIQRDLLAQAQNGSGKTLAFVVPSLIIAEHEKKATPFDPAFLLNPSVIILSDTKELSYQTLKVIDLVKFKDLHANVCLKELNEIDSKVDILLTTVGSLVHYFTQGKINAKRLRLFVLDECDRLFNQDFAKNKLPILIKKIANDNPQLRVTFLSATFPEAFSQSLESINRKTTMVKIENKAELGLQNLTHFFYCCGRKQKFNFVNDFFKKFFIYYGEGSVIIFVNNKQFAERLARDLFAEGHKCEILTSDMSHTDRMNVMDEFRAGKIKVLVSTNLLSRGIDNRKISLVINYDLPYEMTPDNRKGPRHLDMNTYLHRVGRTARFGDQGIALNIVEKTSDMTDLVNEGKGFGISFKEVTLENFSDVIDKSREVSRYNRKKREQLEENI